MWPAEFWILWYKLDPDFIMLLGPTSEPGLPQETFAPVQNLSCNLQDWNNLYFRQKHSHYCSSSKYTQGVKQERWLGLWFWSDSGSERLSHTLPLSEDSLTSSHPLSRPSETILIWSAWAEEGLHAERRICQQQSQEVWSNPYLWMEVYHETRAYKYPTNRNTVLQKAELNAPPQPWNPGKGCILPEEQPAVGWDS